MRPPATITKWLKPEEMLHWLHESSDKACLIRRLAVWLTAEGKLPAHRIAEMLGVSTQSVWLWIKQYNTFGPMGFDPQKRGGRKWYYLDYWQEKEFLADLLRQSEETLPPARVIRQALEKRINKKVSLSYIYKLLQRHNWPHISDEEDKTTPKDDYFVNLLHPWARKP